MKHLMNREHVLIVILLALLHKVACLLIYAVSVKLLPRDICNPSEVAAKYYM
jgi:hypothetical protein